MDCFTLLKKLGRSVLRPEPAVLADAGNHGRNLSVLEDEEHLDVDQQANQLEHEGPAVTKARTDTHGCVDHGSEEDVAIAAEVELILALETAYCHCE